MSVYTLHILNDSAHKLEVGVIIGNKWGIVQSEKQTIHHIGNVSTFYLYKYIIENVIYRMYELFLLLHKKG